ncbi:hypothetical protein ACT3TB_19400 [Micrococcaceae sp. AOP34-BR2-30]
MFNERDQDLYALIFTGPILLAGLFGGIGTWIWTQGTNATAWLIANRILVPADQAVIPILDGGLDLARCVLIGAVAFLLLWGSIAGARRAHKRRIAA